MEVTNKQYYHCAICGKTSTIEKKIKECEASHSQVNTEAPLQTAYSRTGQRYPAEIGVPMKD